MRISDWSADVCSSDLIAIAVAPLIAAGAWISAHFHGWTEMEGRIAIRRGWLKPKTTLLPFASVQSADLATDFILRPFGLATLIFGVPGGSSLGSHEIPAIPREVARSQERRVGQECVSTCVSRRSTFNKKKKNHN